MANFLLKPFLEMAQNHRQSEASGIRIKKKRAHPKRTAVTEAEEYPAIMIRTSNFVQHQLFKKEGRIDNSLRKVLRSNSRHRKQLIQKYLDVRMTTDLDQQRGAKNKRPSKASSRSSLKKEPRLSKHDQENLTEIIQNSLIGIRRASSNQRGSRDSKNLQKQTESLRKMFNIKIQQATKLHKKPFAADDTKFDDIRNSCEVYAATLMGDRHQQNEDSLQYSDNIYIVCDGHGSNGKKVSSFAASTLHRLAKQKLTFGDNQIDQKCIKEVFKLAQRELQQSCEDITFSGSTAVMIVKDGMNVFCANVGDSRAVMISGHKCQVLSKEHKPYFENEKLRIEQCGGTVRQTEVGHHRFSGPMRIWAPGKISWGPGLALSRAFGDKAARKYGIISQPQITCTRLNFQQQFLIVGSDGLFDYMEDQEIGVFLKNTLNDPSSKKQNLCEALVLEAKHKWKGDSDDISCILVFL